MDNSSHDKFISRRGIHERPEMLQLNIDRPLYETDLLCQDYHYDKPEVSPLDKVANFCDKNHCGKKFVFQLVPALRWLRKYKWKKDLVPDIISGITVAIMHIPQGMAYGLLGNLPPVVGIYMAFFPVLIYVIFGTSKHVSMGTFAVACLMTGRVVNQYSNHPNSIDESGTNHSSSLDSTGQIPEGPSPIEVATAVTFMVGMIQLVMYIFQLGVISSLLSEPFVNGFTTGAAVHVLVSQINDLFGLKLPKQRGHFKVIRTIIAVFSEIANTNIAALIVSIVTILIMICNNETLKPWASKKCSFPIPIELLAIVVGTLVSTVFDLPIAYDIRTVGDIPTGLPAPTLPSFGLLQSIILDSIAITMVCYTITMSMSLIFAQKDGYDIDSNQELFAMGCSNIFGAFFSCMPISASLSRSLIQHSVGGRTQFASIVSCGILLVILLWIGPFFEPLPRCVLASVIVVALKGMLFQAREIKRFWNLSKYDAAIWILTLLSTVVVNIDIGLLTGLIGSVASILLQSVTPYACLLGQASDTDLFLDMKRFRGVFELKGLKIFHYSGSINFVNERSLKPLLCREVDINPEKVTKYRLKLAKRGLPPDENSQLAQCIIIDMSSVSFVDPSGVTALRTLVADFANVGVSVYLAACSTPVFEAIKTYDAYKKNESSLQLFATLLDAVHFCQKEHSLNQK